MIYECREREELLKLNLEYFQFINPRLSKKKSVHEFAFIFINCVANRDINNLHHRGRRGSHLICRFIFMFNRFYDKSIDKQNDNDQQ